MIIWLYCSVWWVTKGYKYALYCNLCRRFWCAYLHESIILISVCLQSDWYTNHFSVAIELWLHRVFVDVWRNVLNNIYICMSMLWMPIIALIQQSRECHRFIEPASHYQTSCTEILASGLRVLSVDLAIPFGASMFDTQPASLDL